MSTTTATTLPIQPYVNALLRTLLRTPLISKGIGKRLLILYVVGRKSGRTYEVPVAYMRHHGALLVGSPFGWGKNLRTGEPIEIHYLGRRRTADVQVVADEDGAIDLYRVMARDNHNFAKFNKIGFTASGEPDPDDVRSAYEHGARAFLLTPR